MQVLIKFILTIICSIKMPICGSLLAFALPTTASGSGDISQSQKSQVAIENSPVVAIESGFTIRGFQEKESSFLYKKDGSFADFVNPGFDDSGWAKADSMKAFRSRWVMTSFPEKTLFGGNATAPHALLFPPVLPSEDTSARYYVLRTSFDLSSFDSTRPITLGYTSGYLMGFFVNGHFVGSTLPLTYQTPRWMADGELSPKNSYQVSPQFLRQGKNSVVMVSRSLAWPP